MKKQLIITRISQLTDALEVMADGYSSNQSPKDYSFASFRVPLWHIELYNVGQKINIEMTCQPKVEAAVA